MVQYLFHIRLCIWKLAGKLQIVFLDVLELWYQLERNQAMRLILSYLITCPDVPMGMNLSKILLLTHQSCRVSTIHIPTFRQQCNLPPRYTVSAFHPLPSLFQVDCSRSCFLTWTVMIETNHCFKHCSPMCTKPICIETINLFRSFCSAKAHNSAIQSHSLKVRHDQFFETSTFVPTGLGTLQFCIKLISYVQSCRNRLTFWVRVSLASIYSNSRFAHVCRLADVNLVNNSSTCKHFLWSSNQIFMNFWKRILLVFCEWIKLCTHRTQQTKCWPGNRKMWSTCNLELINAFVVVKLDLFLHSFDCWDNVFVIVPAQKVSEQEHFSLLP